MNKSPELTRNSSINESNRTPFLDEKFQTDLAKEAQIQSAMQLNSDLELSADRSLKENLSRLDAPDLPDALRRAALDQTRHARRNSGWLAVAAALVLSVLVVMAFDPFAEPAPGVALTNQDWAELSLALETLNSQGQQIAQVTRKQVGPHLALPNIAMPSLELQLESLPYPNSFRRWFQPSLSQSQ